MKYKFLATLTAAAVMGFPSPAFAASYQVMYTYYYYDDNGRRVGQQSDRCTSSGVVYQGTYNWGHGTSNVEVQEWIGCQDGYWVPIQ